MFVFLPKKAAPNLASKDRIVTNLVQIIVNTVTPKLGNVLEPATQDTMVNSANSTIGVIFFTFHDQKSLFFQKDYFSHPLSFIYIFFHD